MTKSVRVHYWGRVQGVGFRYETKTLAAGFAVAGYVRNLPDGQVELRAEGAAVEVERFLAAVADRLDGLIAGQRVEEVASEGFTTFDIRRD